MAPQIDPPGRSEDCLACRGTGQVSSGLGGEPTPVACPWCEGSGVRLTAHDAQARWRASRDAAGASAAAPSTAAPSTAAPPA